MPPDELNVSYTPRFTVEPSVGPSPGSTIVRPKLLKPLDASAVLTSPRRSIPQPLVLEDVRLCVFKRVRGALAAAAPALVVRGLSAAPRRDRLAEDPTTIHLILNM
jgi:hypothetical protein